MEGPVAIKIHDRLLFSDDEEEHITIIEPSTVRTDRAAQERLIHWGYAVCDAAMRRHLVAQGDARLWITW